MIRFPAGLNAIRLTPRDEIGTLAGEMNEGMSRILWMKGGALGDFIVALPVLTSLRRAFPDAYLEVACPRAWSCLVEGVADAVSDVDASRWAFLFDGSPDACPRLRYDLAVVLRPDIDGGLRGRLERMGVGRVLVRDPRPAGEDEHVSDHLLRVLDPLGLKLERTPRVRVPGCRGDAWSPGGPFGERCRDGRCAWIHPGSGGLRKCWPQERFRALAELLVRRSFHVHVLLGPVEIERGWSAFWRDAPVALCEGPPLKVVVSALARAAFFVGNDSGISHCAAAVGCRTFVLFGPTSPKVWAPRGRFVRVIRAGSSPPGVVLGDDVETASGCPADHARSMERLSFEDVVRVLASAIDLEDR